MPTSRIWKYMQEEEVGRKVSRLHFARVSCRFNLAADGALEGTVVQMLLANSIFRLYLGNLSTRTEPIGK